MCVPEMVTTANSADLNWRTRACKVMEVALDFLWLVLVFSGQNRALFVGKEAVCQMSTPVLGIN